MTYKMFSPFDICAYIYMGIYVLKNHDTYVAMFYGKLLVEIIE